MSDAISSFGSLLQIGDGATPVEAFTNVAETRDGAGLARTTTTQETTNHQSTQKFREFIGTLKDGGEPSYEMNWIASDSTHQSILTDWENMTARNWRVVYSDDEVDTFTAIITNLTFPTPVDGVRRANITLRTTGVVDTVEQS